MASSGKSNRLCYTYNFKCDKLSQITHLNEARDCAACTVFEGKIVVTGGDDYDEDDELKSVEQYDYFEDKWINLSDLIEERSCHAAVSMGNKMFVIGGYWTTSCEVFDSYSRKFTTMNTSINKPAIGCWYFEAFGIGNIILVFHNFQDDLTDSIVYLYDVGKERWSNIDCGFTKNLYRSKCLKYYQQ